MPLPFWRHPCCSPGSMDTEPVCRTCGTTGEFDGWYLRADESKARYQYIFGLAAMGPHRPLANQLFAVTRSACDTCGGVGLITVDERTWGVCSRCEGTGGFWIISPSEIEAIRTQILEQYPRAEAPDRPIRFIGVPLMQNLGTGLMYDATE